MQKTISPKRRRALLSDFLLVTPPGSRDWYQFRDVLEVDGKAVREHDDRLAKLFIESPRTALERAREVMDSGRRYHLADIGGMDIPLLGIAFLQSYYASHFGYTVGTIDRKLGPSVRVVKFDEWQHPTIFRFGANSDYSSHGRFYIDEPTRRVVRTEVDIERRALPLQVVTEFKFDDTLQAIVPVEMRTPLGTATYGRFRTGGHHVHQV